MSQKKVRKANFTPKEIGILLEEIRMEKLVLCSHFTNEITNARKNEIWASIATKLSSCGADLRTATEAREKWGKLKTEAIQRRDLRRKTGNKPVKIVEHDDIVFDIIGEASPIVDGINVQGTETFLYNTEYPKSSSSTSPSGSPDCSQLQPLKQQSAVNISRVTHLGVEGTTTTIIKLDPNDATITEDATRIYNVMVPSHSASHILAGTPSLDTGIPSNSALNGQVIVVDEVAEINRDAEDGQPILSSTPSCDSSESTPKANTDRRKAARVKNRGRGRLQSKKTSVVGSLLLDNPQQIEEGSVLEQFLKSEIRKNGSIVQTNRSITQTNRVRKKFLENKNHLIEDQRRRMCLETEKLKLEVEFLKRKLNNNEG